MTHTVPNAVITDRAVFFDGWELLWLIAKDGISFQPGGSDDINRLTIQFFVETMTFTPGASHEFWLSSHFEEWLWLHRTVVSEFEIEESKFDKILGV